MCCVLFVLRIKFSLKFTETGYDTKFIGNFEALSGIKCKWKCKCIRNWPLPIGAFQDQCKQIVISKHNLVKNPNWRDADRLAIYRRSREVELQSRSQGLFPGNEVGQTTRGF